MSQFLLDFGFSGFQLSMLNRSENALFHSLDDFRRLVVDSLPNNLSQVFAPGDFAVPVPITASRPNPQIGIRAEVHNGPFSIDQFGSRNHFHFKRASTTPQAFPGHQGTAQEGYDIQQRAQIVLGEQWQEFKNRAIG